MTAPNSIAQNCRVDGSSVAREAAEEIERLEGEVTRLVEFIGLKARAWAAMYPQRSDGRNTFVLFAEWVEERARAALNGETE